MSKLIFPDTADLENAKLATCALEIIWLGELGLHHRQMIARTPAWAVLV